MPKVPDATLTPGGRVVVVVKLNRRTVKDPVPTFEGKGKGRNINVNGKTLKQIREEIIPYYQRRQRRDAEVIKTLRGKLLFLQKKCNKIINDVKRKERKREDAKIIQLKKTFVSKVAAHGQKIANNRINLLRLNKTVLIDGALALPALRQYGKEYKISIKQMGLLVLLNVLGRARMRDFYKYGFMAYKDNWRILGALIEAGLVDGFGDKVKIYTPTIKGIESI